MLDRAARGAYHGIVKAAVLEEFNSPLVIREFKHPKLEPGQMLVRMLASGVCGSDIHMWHGQDPRTPLPTILGHEGVGEVVEINSSNGPLVSVNGREIRPGDRIIWDRGVTCGRCYFCAVRHEPNLCPNRWVYGINRSSADPPHLVGCYADHIILFPNTNILHLDEFPGPSYALLASASCSGATAANAIEAAAIQPGDTVLVQGSGPLGLFLTAFARRVGAGRVIVIGGSPESLILAVKLGADFTISHRTTNAYDRVQTVRQMIGDRSPHGVDVVLESAGNPESINEGIVLLRTGGSYITAGFAIPGTTVSMDCYYEIVRKNLRLQGVWVSHTKHLRDAISLICSNPAPFEVMVTHRFGLEQATEALETMQTRKAVKSTIVFED